jgi:hypothetical protein
MIAAIDAAKEAGDTLGGAFEVIVTGVPPGLGSHVQWDRKLDGRLGQAILCIHAIKAVGIGIGPDVAVRAPLAFLVPGQKPRLIARTVGNVDIVPTLHDLLAGPVQRHYAGRSLVPLFVEPSAPWSRSYFTLAGRDLAISLVRGHHKHLYDRAANLHFHFDLARDPREQEDLFDPSNPEHLAMQREIVEQVPAWFATDSAKDWRPWFARRMRELDPRHPARALPTLLKLMHATNDRASLEPVFRWYREASDDRVRVLILRELFHRARARVTELMTEQLSPIAGGPRALAFVDELSGYDAPQRTARRILELKDPRAR